MNTLTTKKLAEVQAFILTGRAILDHAGSSFPNSAAQVAGHLRRGTDSDISLHRQLSADSTYAGKLSRTSAKLEAMMQAYVGTEWNNPIEVLEWTSFFAGAAAAHCGLASSLTSKLDPDTSRQLSELRDEFQKLLASVIDALESHGRSLAQAQ